MEGKFKKKKNKLKKSNHSFSLSSVFGFAQRFCFVFFSLVSLPVIDRGLLEGCVHKNA